MSGVRPRRRRRPFGWIPDLPDQRDHLYGVIHRPPLRIPSRVDLRARCSPVEDQKDLGSCTAQALVGAMEYLELKDEVPFKDLSRLFVYYNERVILGTVEWDSGATLRDGIKTLAKQGVCREVLWPYKTESFRKKPDRACYREALDHQITHYERIVTLQEMLACLAEGYPFVFGFSVYESFEAPEVVRTGVVPLPGPEERVLGGHAVMGVGFDQKKRTFLVRNSWGTRWGKKGYCTMPFAYLDNQNLATDFWTIRRGENM